jgi:hypothetical protein
MSQSEQAVPKADSYFIRSLKSSCGPSWSLSDRRQPGRLCGSVFVILPQSHIKVSTKALKILLIQPLCGKGLMNDFSLLTEYTNRRTNGN